MCMNNNLIQLFEEARWSGLSAEERLNALRCLEAQSAMEEGRAPLDVRVMGEQEAQGGMLGYYDHRTRGMFLHPRYLHSGGLNLGDFGAGAAVRTVLHEGLHGFQWASVAMGSDRVPAQQLLEWAVNQCCYFAGNGSDDRTLALYFFQPVELDARRHAREKAAQLLSRLEGLTGRADEAFRRSMDVDRRTEEMVREIGRRGLTPQILDSAESRARMAFYRYNPRVDAGGVHIFHEAREALFPNGIRSIPVGYNLPPQYGWGGDGLAASFDPIRSGLCGGAMPGSRGLPGMY